MSDAMRHGILSCVSDASLRDAARTMVLHHVHTIMVSDPADESILGLVTDSSLLVIAAELMHDDGIAHLIVSYPHTGNPIGMLSTLDVAGILARDET